MKCEKQDFVGKQEFLKEKIFAGQFTAAMFNLILTIFIITRKILSNGRMTVVGATRLTG